MSSSASLSSSTMDTQSPNCSMNVSDSELMGIPMPSKSNGGMEATAESSATDNDRSLAWEKAQEALKKFGVSKPKVPQPPPPPCQATNAVGMVDMSVRSTMLQYYPWMAQQPVMPPPYVMRPSVYCPPAQFTYPPYMNPYYPGPNADTAAPQTYVNCQTNNPQQQAWRSSGRPPVQSLNSKFTKGQCQPNMGAAQNVASDQTPIKFTISRAPPVNPSPSFKTQQQQQHYKPQQSVSPYESSCVPDNVRRYLERAYMAVQSKEDRDKLEEYFKKKLNPLLKSGAHKAVDWDREPLPSEVNFVVKMGWTPASELKNASVKTHSEENHVKNTAHEVFNRKKFSRSPQPKRKVPFSPRVRLVSPDDEPYSDSQKKVSESDQQRIAQKKKKKRKSLEKSRWIMEEENDSRREERAKRFARDAYVSRTKSSNQQQRTEWFIDTHGETSNHVVIGTCSDIEKSYFRLTSAPDLSTVRPLSVLQKAFSVVKEKYSASHDYVYANDQLRSIRQDLMIQCIRNWFTVKVYEANARIAIEKKDREEFNQCQSQLKLLYREIPDSPNRCEFTCYRLLYYISVNNTIDQTTLLSELSGNDRKDECIAFALKTREAWALGNYVRLFRLYEKAPRMASYVVDLFLERERKAALNACLKAFRPNIAVDVLGSKTGLDVSELCEWLAKLGITANEGKVDCRQHNNTITS